MIPRNFRLAIGIRTRWTRGWTELRAPGAERGHAVTCAGSAVCWASSRRVPSRSTEGSSRAGQRRNHRGRASEDGHDRGSAQQRTSPCVHAAKAATSSWRTCTNSMSEAVGAKVQPVRTVSRVADDVPHAPAAEVPSMNCETFCGARSDLDGSRGPRPRLRAANARYHAGPAGLSDTTPTPHR
jgi:hypothetical protein